MDVLVRWKPLVASSASISTIFLFLAGSLVCKKFIVKGSTGDTSGFPFVCGFLTSILWFSYGWLKNDDTVITVNLVGSALYAAYIALYLKYSLRKSVYISQIVGMSAVLSVIFIFIHFEPDLKTSLSRMGVICCTVTVLFIAAPLTMLVHVIRTRNTEALPFPIILMSFFVSTLWSLYGIIIDDAFMKIPNIIGTVLAALQLCLFVIFPSISSNITYAKLSQVA